ncbi:MAG: hypothetical protein JOZ15_08920, partial [Acidobacteria bacterium]|nr:hypothetical protein [Acidobacteriota bacterium]
HPRLSQAVVLAPPPPPRPQQAQAGDGGGLAGAAPRPQRPPHLSHPAQQRQLVAYVVPRPGAAPPPEDELRAFLRQRLPDYMVPAVFVPLAELPLTPNGKVDRRALPAPAPGRLPSSGAADAAATRQPPRTAAERLLAGIWKEVLGVAEAGARDDFFALGGHSLLATQVVARVRAAAGVELPLRTIFEAPLLAELAQAVEEQLILAVDGMSDEEAAAGP